MHLGKALAAHLTTHLATRGTTNQTFSVNRQPRAREKGRMVTINEMPGGRSMAEDLIDVKGVQIRVRGLVNDHESAIDLSYEIDEIMRDDSLWPFELDGKTVIAVHKPGGGPSFLHHDQEERTTYVCNYRVTIER